MKMKNRSPQKIRYLLIAVFTLLLWPPALKAEWRAYTIRQPLSVVLERLLEQMGKQKLRFRIKKVFNEKQDGQEGFILQLLPQSTYCTLIFYQNPKKKNDSSIRVFTQNHRDSRLFHNMLTRKLKMKETGIFKPPPPKKAKSDQALAPKAGR